MFGLITLIIAAAAALVGYTQAKAFVSERLRYVDAAQSGIAPVLAGVGATLIGGALAGLLPLVGGGTALLFGVSVGMGVASGQKSIRRALPPGA
ncbi:MAG: hypothetical protein IPK85_15510 [Gemmatimonadetes bacterium]|nr:hypothetical protein [Gemmatimonadota bacterium]